MRNYQPYRELKNLPTRMRFNRTKIKKLKTMMMMMMMMTTVQEESKRDLKSLMQIHISSNVYLNFTERKRNIITTS